MQKGKTPGVFSGERINGGQILFLGCLFSDIPLDGNHENHR
jgi:hypothetical protein